MSRTVAVVSSPIAEMPVKTQAKEKRKSLLFLWYTLHTLSGLFQERRTA